MCILLKTPGSSSFHLNSFENFIYEVSNGNISSDMVAQNDDVALIKNELEDIKRKAKVSSLTAELWLQQNSGYSRTLATAELWLHQNWGYSIWN